MQTISSREKAVSGMGGSTPQEDFKAHQGLLKRVASNLGLEVEVLKDSSHSLVNTLAAVALLRVALPLNEASIGSIKTLWQIPPTSKGREEVLCSHHVV